MTSDHTESALEPIEVGWYIYSGGAQMMAFHLRETGQWSVHLSNGSASDCAWGYIDQALGVWDLLYVDPARLAVHPAPEAEGRLEVAEFEQGVRWAMSELQADYPYGDGPEWRTMGVNWIADRLADYTAAFAASGATQPAPETTLAERVLALASQHEADAAFCRGHRRRGRSGWLVAAARHEATARDLRAAVAVTQAEDGDRRAPGGST